MDYKYSDGGRCAEYRIAPVKKNQVGDCVFRACAIALEQPYKITLTEMCAVGCEIGDAPTGNQVIELYLHRKGWQRLPTPRHPSGGKLQVCEIQHPRAIVHTTQHLTAVINHTNLDTWDNRRRYVNRVYVPRRAAE